MQQRGEATMYFTSADTLCGLMAVTVADNPEGKLLLLLQNFPGILLI